MRDITAECYCIWLQDRSVYGRGQSLALGCPPPYICDDERGGKCFRLYQYNITVLIKQSINVKFSQKVFLSNIL